MKLLNTLIIILIASIAYGQGEVLSTLKDRTLGKTAKLSEDQLINWHFLDYETDTVPGISLNILYNSGLLPKKGKKVIVAVLDTKLDITHEELKTQLWVNEDEIPGNGIDDDKNGYIDDINGWDFLSNAKGEYIKYEHLAALRIVKRDRRTFEKNTSASLSDSEAKMYQQYQNAKAYYESQLNNYEEGARRMEGWISQNQEAERAILALTEKQSLAAVDLDSLIENVSDTIIIKHAQFISQNNRAGITPSYALEVMSNIENNMKKMLNLQYDERKIIGDNPEDISDVFYGSGTITGDVPFRHSIVVSGALAANRSNDKPAQGISDNIVLMPIVMVASGDEFDKDIAVAIRYAVDNGASVINMSWSKGFSSNPGWVQDAMEYASKNNVLLVNASGNNGQNIDEVDRYPSDVKDGKEFIDNLIKVGASNFQVGKQLNASFSNYGQREVDLFAPGVSIHTTATANEYKYSRGTSLATPIVSGVAAMLLSYFPDLSTGEIKKILMESGDQYPVTVKIKNADGNAEEVPFEKLSKSGKILNAYKAFLMAQEISQKGK